MTQLNSQNVIHKEGDNVETVRKYFRIYTKDRVFNVYKDFTSEENSKLEENSNLSVLSILPHYEFNQFMTYDDTPIYINNEQIVAMEIATYMFPERT